MSFGAFGTLEYKPMPWLRVGNRAPLKGEQLSWEPRELNRYQVQQMGLPGAINEGSWGAWGASESGPTSDNAASAENAATGTKVDPAALINALTPLVSQLIPSLTDPVRRVAVLEAKLKHARPGTAHYDNLKARLYAAQRAAGMKVEGEQATRSWRTLGQTGIVVAVGVGLALTYMLVKIAGRK